MVLPLRNDPILRRSNAYNWLESTTRSDNLNSWHNPRISDILPIAITQRSRNRCSIYIYIYIHLHLWRRTILTRRNTPSTQNRVKSRFYCIATINSYICKPKLYKIKMKTLIKAAATVALATITSANISVAQTPIRQLHNPTILDLYGKPAKVPHWGKKNLMIFYIDPDRAGQNQDFAEWLEDSKRAEGPNLVGMGIINLKDAPFIPNGMARNIALRRSAKSGATVLADQTRTISQDWELGNCNNMFVSILINRKGELVYLHKGEFTQEAIDEFLMNIDLLK